MVFQPTQKMLIRESFGKLAADAEKTAEIFYGRLFEIDPSLRSMFKSDMREQGRKLTQTLAVVVAALDHLETVIPAVQSLGKRHIAYGVTKEHYTLVGTALIWTIHEVLGDEATPEVIGAWAATYTLLAETATAGLYDDTSVVAALPNEQIV